jgi:hypothetical protein
MTKNMRSLDIIAPKTSSVLDEKVKKPKFGDNIR